MSSGFLSALEIISALRADEIRIAYYGVKSRDGQTIRMPERRFLSPDVVDKEDHLSETAREYFYESLEPDSLCFHVGPYAKVEILKRGDLSKYVINRDGEHVIDVQKAGVLRIYPHEFVLIGTSEYIEVSDNVAASLYANVRNTDIGLPHISTMIDPGWKGALQIGIANPTNYTKQLRYLDALCIVRFHRLSNKPDKQILERFQSRRPHFGNDWWAVESEEGRKFFPIRKEYSVGGEFSKQINREQTKERIFTIGKWSLSAISIGGLVAIIFFVAKLDDRIKDSGTSIERLIKLEQKVDTIDKIKDQFHLLRTGAHLSTFSPNRLVDKFVIPFEGKYEEPLLVLTSIEGVPKKDVKLEVEYSRVGTKKLYNAAFVTLSYVGAISKDISCTTKWLLVHPSPDELH